MGNTPSAGTQTKPRLLDQVRDKIRFKHYSIRTEQSPSKPIWIDLVTLFYSIRTEQAYPDWIRRFILFHAKRHPAEMGQKGAKLNALRSSTLKSER